MKKVFSWLHVALASFLAIVISVLVTVFVMRSSGYIKLSEDQSYQRKVEEILSLVDKYYVGDVDNKVLADYIAVGCAAGLGDKYAAYFTAEDAQARYDSLYGYFTGMGVQITEHPDTKNMYVLQVHSGSPAEEAGIMKGDEITFVDTVNTVKDGYEAVLQYIKGKQVGDTLNVGIMRNRVDMQLSVTLRQFDSQSVFYQLVGDIGYIHITEFNELGVAQFKNAVDTLENWGAKGLVFDLRGNGGGTITSVSSMLDYLLPKGVIVETRYKDSKYNETLNSDAHEINLPMAVLTNESTASASEIFSQSIKDYGKGVTIGTTTYGKGVVQRTFELSDGSLIMFTIAKYYSKSGFCPDGVGVSPDIKTDWTEEELTYRLVNGIEKDKDFLAAVEYFGS